MSLKDDDFKVRVSSTVRPGVAVAGQLLPALSVPTHHLGSLNVHVRKLERSGLEDTNINT